MPQSGIAGWYGSSIFSFLRHIHTVFHSVFSYQFIFPPTVQEGYLFSTSSAALVIFRLSNDSHSDVKWHLIVVLICISLMISDAEHFFPCACWLSVCLFWRNVYSDLLPIFQLAGWFFVCLLLSCVNCLYILEIKPLLVELFDTIFSHSIGCLFVFFLWFPLLCKSLSVW